MIIRRVMNPLNNKQNLTDMYGKKMILPLLLILISIDQHAQRIPENYSDGAKFVDMLELGRNILITYNMGSDDIRGTPYLFEEFHDGTLYFTNRTKMSGLQINYDCTKREILFSWEGKNYSTGRDDIEYFAILPDQTDSILLFQRIFLPQAKEREYLEILYDSHSYLYKRYLKDYREAQVKSPYHVARDYDEYIDESEYFVKLEGSDIQFLKPQKKAVLKIFPDHTDDLEKFIKEENINFKDETDLVRLIKFYDDLKE